MPRPPERVEVEIVVDVPRRDGKNCYRDAEPRIAVVSYETASRATKDLKWLDARAAEGTRWLDEHRARVNELRRRRRRTPSRSDANALQSRFMNAPKPASLSVPHDADPALAAFDNALEEPLSEEERIAFEEAMASAEAGISTDELLERLRPKP